MKTLSAIVLALLLALPVGLIAMPHQAQSTTAITPLMFIFPASIDLEGPCQKGTTFNVDVWLLNIDMEAKSDVYAFDFSLDWSSIVGDDGKAIIGLVNDSIVVHPPWPAGGYFIVANETTPASLGSAPGNKYYTDYHLSMTAVPPKGAGLWDVNQSLVTLTFIVLQDACWPNSYLYGPEFGKSGGIVFTNCVVSGDGKVPLPILMTPEDGSVGEVPFQPNIDISSTSAVFNDVTGQMEITEKCVSQEVDVQIDLSNVTKVYGYGFELAFDPYHKEIDLQKTNFKPGFPPPYEYFTALPGPLLIIGGKLYATIDVICVRPSEKPTICGAKVPIFDVVFHTIDLIDPPGMLATKYTSVISIQWAFVLAKGCGPSSGTYIYGFAGGETHVPAGYTGTAFVNPTGVPFDGGAVAAPGDGTVGLVYGFYDWAGTTVTPLTLPLGSDTSGLKWNTLYVLYYNDIVNIFKPSKYDLNLDCVVDIQDLIALLPYYGAPVLVDGTYADLFEDESPDVPPYDPVDIFDFVAIAKHFGPVDP